LPREYFESKAFVDPAFLPKLPIFSANVTEKTRIPAAAVKRI